MFPEFADLRLFFFRQNTCDHLVHSCLCADGFCCALVVPGQHNDSDSHLTQLSYRLRTVLFDRVCYGNQTGTGMVFGKKQRCFSLFCQFLCLFCHGRIHAYLLLHIRNTSAQQQIFSAHRGKSVARQCLKIVHCSIGNTACLCMLHNRLCQRMFTGTLQIRSKLHQLPLRISLCRENVRHMRFPGCDCSGLVQCHDLRFSCILQCHGIFEKDSVFGSHAVSDHDRYRCCKSQCTRTADNEHGNPARQCKTDVFSGKQPDDDGDPCNGDDRRYKHTGYFIGDFCNRRLGSCRIRHHPDDLGKRGVFSHTGCLTAQEPGLVRRCRADGGAFLFVDRNTLSGECCLVDRTATFYDNSIDRNIFPRTHDKDIPLPHFCN